MRETLLEIVTNPNHRVWQKIYRYVPEETLARAVRSGTAPCPRCNEIVPGYRLIRGQWRPCTCRRIARDIDRDLGLSDGCDTNAGILQ